MHVHVTYIQVVSSQFCQGIIFEIADPANACLQFPSLCYALDVIEFLSTIYQL